MTETLKELIEFIKDTAQTELPLVANEILRWGLISEIIWCVCWFLLGTIIVVLGRELIKWNNKDTKKLESELEGIRKDAKENKLSHEQHDRCQQIVKKSEILFAFKCAVWGVGGTLTLVPLICFIVGVVNIIYINVAPRLYIIDYIKDLT